MCKKLPYNNPRWDKCLVDKINEINDQGEFKTLSSCCGHGKYPTTIVVMRRTTKTVTEIFSGTYLGEGRRKGNRYYRRDLEGHYYIPEVMKYYLLYLDNEEMNKLWGQALRKLIPSLK